MMCFNPRSRAGSDQVVLNLAVEPLQFQSTLPRGERPAGSAALAPWNTVSIHAPARGATSWSAERASEVRVSIHAPARGATPLAEVITLGMEVSIHAPARGATDEAGVPPLYLPCFNPRSRAGSDQEVVVTAPPVQLFQSTLPRGERPPQGWVQHRHPHVSIHAPARGATSPLPPRFKEERFQSTLPRGERLPTCCACSILLGFQSTLPRGERLLLLHTTRRPFQVSIHAPARERLSSAAFSSAIDMFQSTLPRGERPESSAMNQNGLLFQSTLPRGERR